MNKQKFTNIIQIHTFIDHDDVRPFQKLAEQYPYSQILHTLIAKHHNEIKSDQAKELIQRAAIYATDRAILKEIIQSKTNHAEAKKPPSPARVTEQRKQESAALKSHSPSKKFEAQTNVVSDIDQLRKSLFIHLEELQENKKPFETKSKKIVKKATTLPRAKAKVKEKAKSKKKDNLTQNSSTPSKKKAKAEPSSLSQKEQVDLIEKFIKSPPKIPKGKVKSETDKHQEDLSRNSTKIEEDFASENLAQILIKQGNKEKAIDIYKKLIWKFPQKKAYFATQIEGLKK